MSNLIKPYEISVWDDVWENGAFAEKRLGIIGTDKMQSQNRALEANFSRNVNGVKKLSFKMYKQYKDSITGEDVINPYIDWLVSERKVKLYYEDQWHDFIVKNINENSSNYLYTYQLEDALVQELSKNGFGKILDAKLMNNMGTASQLATEVLEETDWEVATDSEAFVQTVDESLVYLTLPSNISGLNIKHIKDQTILTSGISVENATGITGGKTILAFYSSCTNKPHRFQFIYVSDLSNLQKDENRNIINKDCQYYIDFDNPEEQYNVKKEAYDFYLPTGFNTITVTESNVGGVVLSSLYRGKRYGFAQQSRYIPVLNKYVKLYDKNGEEYYGYQHTEYNSPALTQNVISNTTFESTSGWTGTHDATGKEKAKIENVFGYFEDNHFVDSIDELKSGTFMELDANGKPKKNYKAYLKITFPNRNARIINSGPFDNRTLIGKMEPGDEWALRYTCRDATGMEVSGFNISLGEYSYISSTDGYSLIEEPKITFNALTNSKAGYTLTKNGKTYGLIKINTSTYSAEDFKKKMKVRVCIEPPSISTETVYYLEEIELFKATFNKDKVIIIPEEQGIDLEDRVIDKTYYYFKPSALEGISNEEQLIPETISKTLSYEIYEPKYNESAQKIRSVSAKESNYFNILQSIAETFEAWLLLKITRDDPDEPGKITKKEIAFKNYAGNENHAGFRYGVNLRDIQRTYESKNIVTKLIVKQNSNELGENGFCTIARAGANPTGENYIYDFQYFFNRGLINPTNYLNTMYVVDGQSGPDVNSETEYNLQGYFPRIKALNNHIQEQNEILINTAKDLTQYKAELEIAEAGKEAANSGVEQTRDDFEALTGVPIDQISSDKITAISLPGGKQDNEESAKETYGYYCRETDWLNNIVISISGRTVTAAGTIKSDKISETERHIYVKIYPQVTLANGTKVGTEYSIKCEFPSGEDSGSGSVDVEIVDVNRTDVKRLLQEFAVYNSNELKYTADMEVAQENVNTTQAVYDAIEADIEQYKTHKINLNQKFFSQYSRFIQEGTWISEEYVDDEKYYADALSVMYNSCYPQVAYSINVVELSKLPGYEHFIYGLGDRTYVEDFEFFGEGNREKVIITEINEVLDDPSKNVIKVQNFKNQFQDLFQKITATVQQAQYSTGSYEKAVALAEANQARKQQFLTDALDSASARLSAAGQQSVTWGNDGITVKSVNSPCDAIRMVGGAILLSKQDENGEQRWVTGVTSDGVSASLITAGILNAGEITIMNYDQPVFRWDSFGISAYDSNWYDSEIGTVVSGVNSRKFVRFDKHGLYGINNAGVDGASWHPNNTDEINEKATFALTWEGLKITGSAGGVARLGKQNGYIMLVHDSSGNGTFGITEDGKIQTRGIEITDGTIGGEPLASTNHIKDAVDSINIGGRNLLTKEKLDGYKQKKDILNNSLSKFGYIRDSLVDVFGQSSPLGLKANTDYTISFTAWATTDTSLIWDLWVLPSVGDENLLPQETVDLTTTPTKYSWTVSSTASFMPQSELRFLNFDKEGNKHTSELPIYITDIQIEEGTKATTWSPAPEDVSADIAATNTLIQQVESDLQSQIDGEITSWFYAVEPTTNNAPANEWTTESEKIRHEGDLYYNTESGAAYRWVYFENTKQHGWTRITDEAIAEALAAANNAQTTADGKMTVYVSLKDENNKDIVPQVGDLLIPTADIAGTNYKAGKVWKYNGTSWEEISYTDDSALNTFLNGDYKTYQDSIKTQLDGKAEIFFTSYDPAVYSGELVWGETEKGNLWHCTNPDGIETMVMVNTGTQGIAYNQESVWDLVEYNGGTGYGWKQIEIPHNIFSAYDGKATLYVTKPQWGYKKNDLWILDETTQASDDCPTYTPTGGTATKYKEGTLLVASKDSETYVKADWVEKIRYTDDTYAKTVENALTTLTGQITDGDGIFKDGINKVVTKDYIEEFDLTAKSILIYNGIPDSDDVKRIFSAETLYDAEGNANGGAVYLAGWTVTENQLSIGTLGSLDSYLMYPSGYKTSDASETKTYFGQTTDKIWALGIGVNFGVTINGELYCTGGTIAGWTVLDSILSNGDTKLYGNKAEEVYFPLDITGGSSWNTESPIRISVGKQTVSVATSDTTTNQTFSKYIPIDPKNVKANKSINVYVELYSGTDRRIKNVDITQAYLYLDYADGAYTATSELISCTVVSIQNNTVILSVVPKFTFANDSSIDVLTIELYARGSYNYLPVEWLEVPSLGILEDGRLFAESLTAKQGAFDSISVKTSAFTFTNESSTQGFVFWVPPLGGNGVISFGPRGFYETTLENRFVRGYTQLFGRKIPNTGSTYGGDMLLAIDDCTSEGLRIDTDGFVHLASRANGLRIIADYDWIESNGDYKADGKGNLLALLGHRVELQSGTSGQNDGCIGGIYLNGTLYTDSSISDLRMKKNIEDLSNQYENLFDLLRPVRYKYINGTSDRYHTGFIAQEVVSSIEASKLSTKDFAAVVIQDPGTEQELWQLRRDEFIALNTWQIQKLKLRASSLEQTIINYEMRISALEKEIQNLIKS